MIKTNKTSKMIKKSGLKKSFLL